MALGHRVKIFIQIRFPMCCEKNSLLLFLFLMFEIQGVCVGEGIYPLITLNLKKGTKTSDYQSNGPNPKFLGSPFLYMPYMPPGDNLTTLALRALGGGVILKGVISRPFMYIKHNGYVIILIGSAWENGGPFVYSIN